MTDHPWHRMILLEELGTASSWIVLLLPYVVFLVALLLDGDVDFWQTSSGPMSTQKICNSESNSTWDSIHSPSLANVQDRYSFPITPLPSTSCSYKYQIGVEEFSSDLWTNKITIDKKYKDYMSLGVAFTSGPLQDVPVLSSFLYGDLTYESLSSESVSLVADGLVEYSTVVMQQQLGDDPAGDDKWFPVSFSKPNKLSMICERGRKSSRAPFGINKGEGREDIGWKCQSPRNVDVLFYLMDSSFLTGGSLRVDTIISHSERPRNATIQDIPYATNMTVALPSAKSTVYSDHIEDLESTNISHADHSNPEALIAEIAQSVSYTFTHSSQLRTQVLISVRIACLLLSISFLIFWFWSMGVDGFFVCGCWPSFLRDEQKYNSEEESILKTRKAETFWWECPWIIFPERRYLLLLMISLILIQNPVLTYMYFHPILNSSAKMHFIADSIIGIGFHSFLCLWLCLCQGLRYHTAKSARQRADRQKEVLTLRRAAMYLSSSANRESMYNSYGSTTDHVASYYDEFGDVHGSWKSLRLKHDPCGDGWADFLLPKMALLLLGASAAIFSSALRFSCDFGKSYEWSTIAATKELPDTFVVASIFQVAILSLWCILIIRAAVRTGHLLRKESFLSTRPAQLAYRILMGILILGICSVLIPLIIDVSNMMKKWKILQWIGDYRTVEGASGLVYSSSSDYYIGEINRSTTDIMLNIALHAYQRFPYSGSAASLGPGEIIYITACTLVIAFIFLPSTTYMFILENSNNDADALAERGELHQTPKENQRRDKRDFLTLSRYTHTWRVFPLPIERHRHVKIAKGKPKTVDGFQLNKDFNTLPEKLGRGTIYEKNYIPLYCIETALWLLECSWQTYYSTTEYKTDGFAPGIMNLDTLGLNLEADIYNESSDTRVFVASNIAPQVDGEADSMIVVAFRGTASTTNIKTDLNIDQQALPKYFNQDQPEYQIHLSNTYDLETEDGENCARVVKKEDESGTSFRQEADALLRSAPITRQVFPCVHSGFLEAYNLIKDEVIDAVVKVMKRQITKSLRRCSESNQYLPLVLPKIYVTGHSLGGALGQLLALDISCNIEIRIGGEPVLQKPKHVRGLSTPFIKKTFSADASSPMKPVLVRRNSFPSRSKTTNSDTGDVDFIHGMLSGICFAGAKIKPRSIRPPIAVYTFGQPRVGNRAFARFFKAHVPHTFRVVAEGDAITVLPLATIRSGLAFYKHAGLDVILDEGSTGNILIGPTVVETLFRFSKVRTKLSNHLLDVYRNGLQSALTSEEVQEFYRTHGVNSRSIRSGYNVADVIPDWVTHFSRR
uniref:Fungal lipase-type domain-containing protein n=1 Tax=Chaetoceros debilis TaxID=122233 RepID=A0A7S3PV14_9STRA